MRTIETISAGQLRKRMSREKADHSNTMIGYALVNVQPPAQFARGHIAGSINVPLSELDVLEGMFQKVKEIIVYCASDKSPLSGQAAQRLYQRGFTRVRHFRGGTEEWKDSAPGRAEPLSLGNQPRI